MDRDNLPFYVMAIVGFTMAAIGIIGEYLGWWHLLGEVLSIAGTVAGILGLALPFVVGPSRVEVRRGFQGTNAKLDGANAKLDGLQARADTTNTLLAQIRDRLGPDA